MTRPPGTTSQVEINGTMLAYQDAGCGGPVVFIHGSLDDYRSWRYQIAPFAERYRVIAYSRRYHFPNARPEPGAAYTPELHAADLAALIRALALAPVHLVTSSYGGNVALQMLTQDPGLVRSLVLGEPPLLPWLFEIPGGSLHARGFQDHTWFPARQAFAEGKLEDGCRLFLDGVMGRPTYRHLSEHGRRMILDNAPEMSAETKADSYFPQVTCFDATRLTCPILMLKGEASPPMFGLITERLVHCLPQARIISIPRASHVMHIQNHTAYNAAVLAFLAETERSTDSFVSPVVYP